MRLLATLYLFIVGGVLLLTGCAGGERTAEREVEAAASRYIGPADRYEANVSGLTATSARQVRITGYGVRPEPNIELQSLVLTATDVQYQRNPFRITRVGTAQFTVQATDTAVTAYLASQLAQQPDRIPLRNPQVTFLRDQARIAGTAMIDGDQVPISITGTLRPQGAQVFFVPQTITVEETPRGQQLRAVISRIQVLLIDLSRLTFEPQIQTITLRPGIMTITGTGNANRLLDAQPAQ